MSEAAVAVLALGSAAMAGVLGAWVDVETETRWGIVGAIAWSVVASICVLVATP